MAPVRRPAFGGSMETRVTVLEVQQGNLQEALVAQGARTDHNVADVEQKLDKLCDKFEEKIDELSANLVQLGREVLSRNSYQDGAGAVLKLGWRGLCAAGAGMISLIVGAVAIAAKLFPHWFVG